MIKNLETDAAENDSNRSFIVFFLCFAALLFLFASIFAVWNFYQLMTFSKVEGVVASIGVRETGGKTPATFYDLSVGFEASKRQIYTHAGTTVFYSPYDKGEKVMVYYDPQNPNEAFVNAFGTIWFVPTLLFLIGLVPLIISKPKTEDYKKIYQKLRG